MKKLILSACVLLAAVMTSNAQITLEHEYVPTIHHYKMSNGDVKLIEYPNNTGDIETITIYNSDHSLYKTVTFPIDTLERAGMGFVSDHLFNSDNKLEFILNYSIGTGPNAVPVTKIYTEDTVLIFSKDSAFFPVTMLHLSLAEGIYKDANGYKMMLNHRQKHATQPLWITDKVLVYSLPGTLPLMAKPVESANKPLHIADPFPNPAVNEKVIIPYALPDGVERGDIIFTDLNGREVKTFTVTHTFNTLELDGQLPHGTYFYQLKAGTVTTGAKKLIVIK